MPAHISNRSTAATVLTVAGVILSLLLAVAVLMVMPTLWNSNPGDTTSLTLCPVQTLPAMPQPQPMPTPSANPVR